MSRFTTPVGTIDSAGATSDMFTRNALACAGTGALVGVAGGSVLAVAVAAPLQMAGFVTLAGGAIYAGNRIADGESINPFAKKEDEVTTEAVSPTTEAVAPAAA